VLRERGVAAARAPAVALLGALALQLTIGVSMVLRTFPLWLATAHTAGAALLLLATLWLLHRTRSTSRLRWTPGLAHPREQPGSIC